MACHHVLSSSSNVQSSASTMTEPIRTYDIYHPDNSLANLLIMSSSPHTPVYYAQMAIYKKHVPDIQLFSISSSALQTQSFSAEEESLRSTITAKKVHSFGQRVGVAYLRKVYKTHKVRLCIGDPEHVKDNVWCEMIDKKLLHGVFLLTIPETNSNENGFVNAYESAFKVDYKPSLDMEKSDSQVSPPAAQQNPRTYKWLRTHSKEDGLENAWVSRKMSCANFKFANDVGRVLAVFESNGMKSFRKMGKLKIFDCPGLAEQTEKHLFSPENGRAESDDVMTILSYCIIQEKRRRGH